MSLDLVADAREANADLVEQGLRRLEHLTGNDDERVALARKLAANGAGNYLYMYHLTRS